MKKTLFAKKFNLYFYLILVYGKDIILKTNQRVLLTKRLLKDSLIDLMSKKSIQKIRVNELCENAGINRTTFYKHYGSPYDVMEEIENDILNDMEKILNSAEAQEKKSYGEKMALILHYLKDNIHVTKTLLSMNPRENEFILKIAKLPEIGKGWLSFSDDSTDEIENNLAFIFYITGLYRMITYWLLNDLDKTPEEIGELCEKILHKKW